MQSGLTVLTSEGEKVELRRVVSEIVSSYPRDFTFSRSEEEILKPFLNREAAIAIDFEGIGTAVDCARNLFKKGTSSENIVVRTVFGATEKMPFRAFHYLIPAVKYAQALEELDYQMANGQRVKGLTPKLEFIFMNQMGELSNGTNTFIAHEETLRFTAFARAYLEKFYPQISRNVSFLDDRVFTPNVYASDDYKEATRRLKSLNDNILGKLTSFAKSKGDIVRSLEYGAMHVFVHDLLERSSPFPFIDIERQIPVDDYPLGTKLFSMGASPEAFFYQLRKALLKADGFTQFQQVQTGQYIVGINVPPYSMLANMDLSLEEVVETPNILFSVAASQIEMHTPVRKALAALTKEGDVFELINFFKEGV